MKKVLLSLLFITAVLPYTKAQEKAGNPVHGVPVAPVVCGGIANVQEGNYNWGAALVNRSQVLLPAPGQQFIDSIKAAKLNLKDAIENLGGAMGRTTSIHPVVGVNFPANVYSGTTPSNNSIAISDSGYIVTVNSTGIAFYKANGTLMYSNLITNFMPFGSSISVTNPVVTYDTRADRFIFVCQQMPLSDTGKMYICYSRSSNPGASVGWFCYSLRSNPAGGDAFDFPRIAVNDSELFITGNLYGSFSTSPYFDKPIIHQIDKRAGYSGAAMSSIYYPYIAGGAFGLLPVSDGHTAGITTGMYLVSTVNGGGNIINLYKITGNLFSSPSISYTTISTGSYGVAANSHQLGTSGLLNVGDCRILSGFKLDSTIHFVFNCDAGGGYCGINYNRLNLATNTNVSTTFGVTGTDYAYPTVVSYATTLTDPSVVIGFGASGTAIYPQVMAVNCDSAMTWSATTLVKSSTTYVGSTSGVSAWGNYSGSSRRHNSAAPSVWMNSGYGNPAHNWDTYVAEIHDAATTPCPAPTGLYVNGLTTYSVVLHWVAVGGALMYNVQYKPSASSTWTSTTSTTLLKSITGLTYGTHYDYQVQAMCSDSSLGAYTADTFTTKSPGVGVQELNGETVARVYPNPVSGKFSVEFTLAAAASLEIAITDVTGRVVKQLYNGVALAGLNEFSFQTTNLPNGVYILSITSAAQNIKKEKIVIAN